MPVNYRPETHSGHEMRRVYKWNRWECQKCGRGDRLRVSQSALQADVLRDLDIAHRAASPLCIGRVAPHANRGEAVFCGDMMVLDRNHPADWISVDMRSLV